MKAAPFGRLIVINPILQSKAEALQPSLAKREKAAALKPNEGGLVAASYGSANPPRVSSRESLAQQSVSKDAHKLRQPHQGIRHARRHQSRH
jgi:hypothetical protein